MVRLITLLRQSTLVGRRSLEALGHQLELLGEAVKILLGDLHRSGDLLREGGKAFAARPEMRGGDLGIDRQHVDRLHRLAHAPDSGGHRLGQGADLPQHRFAVARRIGEGADPRRDLRQIRRRPDQLLAAQLLHQGPERGGQPIDRVDRGFQPLADADESALGHPGGRADLAQDPLERVERPLDIPARDRAGNHGLGSVFCP
jgi:hypothetical protein